MTLTASEERKCQLLRDEGFEDLAKFMRERYIRQHELFEELKHADVDALYGAFVSETVLNSLKNAIVDGDHELVAALHSWCEVSKDKSKKFESVTPASRFGGAGLLIMVVVALAAGIIVSLGV